MKYYNNTPNYNYLDKKLIHRLRPTTQNELDANSEFGHVKNLNPIYNQEDQEIEYDEYGNPIPIER